MLYRNSFLVPSPVAPFAEFNRLSQLMDSLMVPAGFAESRFPAVHVLADENHVTVVAEVPGIESKDLDISVEGKVFVLKITRPKLPVAQGETVLRSERLSGTFERSLELPYAVDPAKVEATLKLGLLKVVLPRVDSDRPRRIEIAAG